MSLKDVFYSIKVNKDSGIKEAVEDADKAVEQAVAPKLTVAEEVKIEVETVEDNSDLAALVSEGTEDMSPIPEEQITAVFEETFVTPEDKAEKPEETAEEAPAEVEQLKDFDGCAVQAESEEKAEEIVEGVNKMTEEVNTACEKLEASMPEMEKCPAYIPDKLDEFREELHKALDAFVDFLKSVKL